MGRSPVGEQSANHGARHHSRGSAPAPSLPAIGEPGPSCPHFPDSIPRPSPLPQSTPCWGWTARSRSRGRGLWHCPRFSVNSDQKPPVDSAEWSGRLSEALIPPFPGRAPWWARRAHVLRYTPLTPTQHWGGEVAPMGVLLEHPPPPRPRPRVERGRGCGSGPGAGLAHPLEGDAGGPGAGAAASGRPSEGEPDGGRSWERSRRAETSVRVGALDVGDRKAAAPHRGGRRRALGRALARTVWWGLRLRVEVPSRPSAAALPPPSAAVDTSLIPRHPVSVLLPPRPLPSTCTSSFVRG